MDEAQNSTPFQMKMFLTRLGFDSKTVITGDLTQSDLPKGTTNGLSDCQRVLEGIEGIKFIAGTNSDGSAISNEGILTLVDISIIGVASTKAIKIGGRGQPEAFMNVPNTANPSTTARSVRDCVAM